MRQLPDTDWLDVGEPCRGVVRIGLGQGMVARGPAVLTSVGIGCCVVLALYDPERALGGLAHVLLPEAPEGVDGLGPFACADTALTSLVNDMVRLGAAPERLVAKLAGGARMFPNLVDDHESIGKLNSLRLRALLDDAGIPLVGHDLGGHHGRSVELHLAGGLMRVTAVDRLARAF